jgi:hypothetical protein
MAELNFIELLKKHLDDHGLSVEAASVKSGIPRLHIEKVINGHVTLTASQEEEMAARIGLTIKF